MAFLILLRSCFIHSMKLSLTDENVVQQQQGDVDGINGGEETQIIWEIPVVLLPCIVIIVN